MAISKDFIHGFALAISVAYRENCEPRPLKSAIKAAGITLADFKKAKVEKYDIDSIKSVMREG